MEEGKLPVLADRNIYTSSTQHTGFAIAGNFLAADSELGITIIITRYPSQYYCFREIKKEVR